MSTAYPRKNAEGYSDPTAYEAVQKILREERRRTKSLPQSNKPRKKKHTTLSKEAMSCSKP